MRYDFSNSRITIATKLSIVCYNVFILSKILKKSLAYRSLLKYTDREREAFDMIIRFSESMYRCRMASGAAADGADAAYQPR